MADRFKVRVFDQLGVELEVTDALMDRLQWKLLGKKRAGQIYDRERKKTVRWQMEESP